MNRWIRNRSGLVIPNREAGFIQPGIGLMNKKQGGGGGGDPYWNNVVSLLHFDEGDGSTSLVDQVSSNVWSRTGTSVVESATQKKFGASSLYNPGTSVSDRFSCPSSVNLNLSGADVTVECWVYPTALRSTWNTIVCKDYISGSVYWSYVFALFNGKIRWSVGNGVNTVYHYEVDGVTSVPLNTWSFITAVQKGASVYLFLNGVLDKTAAAGTVGSNSRPVVLATLNDPGATQFSGYIDDLRITKGIGRYTTNFTPPTAPFPNHS